MPKGETKAQRFERIAERRVNETLRALRLLGNLADRRNYDYTEQQANLILEAIEQDYRALKSKFRAESAVVSQPFKFR